MWDQRNVIYYNVVQVFNYNIASQLQPTLQTHQQNKIIKLLTQKIKTKLPHKKTLDIEIKN